MEKIRANFLNEVADYYSEKLLEHGNTPRGVDWNGADSQIIRFEQLCKLIDSKASSFSLSDIGCGYGALFDFLSTRYSLSEYVGLDISAEMIRAAQIRNTHLTNVKFILSSEPNLICDYGVASGIFNVRLQRTDAEWYDYLIATLDVLDKSSRLGFAFNCLTSYSDADKKRDYLYYADPHQLFDHCMRHYSRQVALLHDYGLFEFTIIVRKLS